jgi:hypothetical protein
MFSFVTDKFIISRHTWSSPVTTSFHWDSILAAYAYFLYTALIEVRFVDPIQEVVRKYLHCVMLSHQWEGKESLLRNIGNDVYEFAPVGGIVKLQSFCKTARDAGYLLHRSE